MGLPTSDSAQIQKNINELQRKIEELKTQKVEALRNEQRYLLLTGGHSGIVQAQASRMSDAELAKKCRSTSFSDFISALGHGLNFQPLIPLQISGLHISTVLCALDMVADTDKLDELANQQLQEQAE